NTVQAQNVSRHDEDHMRRSKEPPKEEAEEGTWPASLRRYLQRAFDNCNKGQGSRQHEQLEKALHRKVTDAMADNSMLTTDWDNEPLPRYAASIDRTTLFYLGNRDL
ncbi:unnamed protein product, partial [Sphacelaria rigidula]